MAIKISEKLNLVIPLYHGNQVYSYVYSTPISREIFELNHLLIAKTFTKIMAEGLGTISGPRVAAMLMRDVAKQMDAQQQFGIDGRSPRVAVAVLQSLADEGEADVLIDEPQ